MAKTNIQDFLGELDAGIFENKLATALSDVALGVLNHDKQGVVKIEFTLRKWIATIRKSKFSIN
ncbi:hypothetical protein ACN9OK_12025 [Glaesserella parasuis]|uniref:hypothetical protein n=1 Tax=Glaesserella parasuis TaxID=738 RepID=UPI003B67D7F0